MSFKDIVNRNNVNLQNCEDEPIHVPGSIQPHGFLISVASNSLQIEVCSQNVSDYINYTYEQILTQPLAAFFDEDFIQEISAFHANTKQQGHVFNSTIAHKLFSITLNKVDNSILIEGEPIAIQFNEFNYLYNSSKKLLSYIEDTFTLKELSNSVAIAIKKITGYDRVMVYRFDENYNGEVIAESKEDNLEPYLGLHYPHTDIPVQARELYIKNHLRIIGDVHYTPVPLYKSSSNALETLDLSLSVLRSVSPIHIEYLKNMQVGSTLTISLLHKGKLWGLITCHHYSAKYLSQEIRTAVKLHGHFITSQIDVRLLNEQYDLGIKCTNELEQLTSKNLEFTRASLEELFNDTAILELCNSVGVSAYIDSEIYTCGDTPPNENIKRLSEFLSQYTDNGNFSTNSLSKITSDLPYIATHFPGINYYFLGNDVDCIIWYKAPTIKDIHWAGDPTKSVDKSNGVLTPRKSFAIFTESVRDCSKEWRKVELAACHSFFNFFQLHLRSIFLNEEKENQRELSKVLQEANAELENINWISTHDLQEPLRKIRFMSSMIIGDDMNGIPEDVQAKIIKIQNSAERMQTLINDILKYTKTSAAVSHKEKVNLNSLFEEIKVEFKEVFEEKEVTIQIANLPVVNGISFLLKQLFSNIIYNSLKFKNDTSLPVLTITSHLVTIDDEITNIPEEYYKISVSDNGIGFDNIHNEKIFKIFARLNNQNKYTGSGVGLALCKKIMTKHNGFITADGKPNEGATFHLYFPIA